MSTAADGYRLEPQQQADETAMLQVSDVLLNLEHTIARTKKGIERARRAGGNPNVELALGEALVELQKVHKRLMHETYYASQTRLI